MSPRSSAAPAARRPGAARSGRPIVVGTDFSPGARIAVWRAARLADALGAPLVVVHAASPPRSTAATPPPRGWAASASAPTAGSRAAASARPAAAALALARRELDRLGDGE